MLTNCTNEQSSRPRHLIMKVVESISRVLLGEPFALVPKRKLEHLRRLERREQLRSAERRGDNEFLDHELKIAQAAAAARGLSRHKITPIDQWPDEEDSDTFLEKGEEHQSGAGI